MYKLWKCLTEDVAMTMVHAMPTSGLNYINNLHYVLPNYLLNRLQSVQKVAGTAQCQAKYEYTTPSMKTSHWLAGDLRPQFKILVLTCSSLYGLAPSELLIRRPE